jgi:two-component system chemotaxis response regulator CheB
MGVDGAEGILKMRQAGGYNITQDEENCVVFGMPRVAIEKGATHKVLPLDNIVAEMLRASQENWGDLDARPTP